jgi:hypothetical protein
LEKKKKKNAFTSSGLEPTTFRPVAALATTLRRAEGGGHLKIVVYSALLDDLEVLQK